MVKFVKKSGKFLVFQPDGRKGFQIPLSLETLRLGMNDICTGTTGMYQAYGARTLYIHMPGTYYGIHDTYITNDAMNRPVSSRY
jgi:hypothetical protein